MSAETTRALAHNTLLQMGGKAVAMVLGVATVSVMLHYFGDEGYGDEDRGYCQGVLKIHLLLLRPLY